MLSDMPDLLRYTLEFAYHGNLYHGWQIQPNAITVQGTMNEALTLLLGKEVNLVGAGRTDTGVHASHFVAHFDWPGEVLDTSNLVYKLNSILKNSIRIDRIELAKGDFHSRFSAIRRTYHYIICLDSNPFLSEFSWQLHKNLNVDLMNREASQLLGKKDFTSFAKLHADTKTNICDLQHAKFTEQGSSLIFEIRADRFLRNMVRAIVGTLVDIGQEKSKAGDISSILLNKDRSLAGQSAPAKGLFLSRIDYPPELMTVFPKSPFPQLF